MSSIPPIAVLADPGPWAQWAGIIITCLGTGLSIWAALAAQAATTAAKGAKEAAERFAGIYELQAIQDDLVELIALCNQPAADLAAIAKLAAKLGPRMNVAAGPQTGETRDRIMQAARTLQEIVPASLEPDTPKAQKVLRISEAVSQTQFTLSDAQRLLRHPPSESISNDSRSKTAIANLEPPEEEDGGGSNRLV